MRFSEKTVKEISELLLEQGEALGEEEMAAISQDARAGVRKAYAQFNRLRALREDAKLRHAAMQEFEREARSKGFALIAGVDEAGRGPLAGPVVAAAVILPQEVRVVGIDDSKKLSPVSREHLFQKIKQCAVSWSVGISTVDEIDSINILQASLLAMRRAVEGLDKSPDFILTDAVRITGISTFQLPIIKGDQKSISIAAASIIAKVTRDRLMTDYDTHFPGYGFDRHKGYGTREHLEAISSLGPCLLHRKSFLGNIPGGGQTGEPMVTMLLSDS